MHHKLLDALCVVSVVPKLLVFFDGEIQHFNEGVGSFLGDFGVELYFAYFASKLDQKRGNLNLFVVLLVPLSIKIRLFL